MDMNQSTGIMSVEFSADREVIEIKEKWNGFSVMLRELCYDEKGLAILVKSARNCADASPKNGGNLLQNGMRIHLKHFLEDYWNREKYKKLRQMLQKLMELNQKFDELKENSPTIFN